MPVNTVLPPLQLFTGADGQPLEGGYIFIGETGFEARSTPKASFFDAALTIPTGTATGAAVRTSAGYPIRNGQPATIYVDGNHSITVTDKNLRVVFAMLNRTFELGAPTAIVGPVVAPDGNLLTTGFGFISEPDTGLVRSAPATMQLVVDGTPVFSLTPTGVEVLQPMNGVGSVGRRIAQGTLSGAELIVAIPADIDWVDVETWNYLPSTTGTALTMQIGTGTVGSPTWITSYDRVITLNASGTLSGLVIAGSTAMALSPAQITSAAPGSSKVRLGPFNTSSAVYARTDWAGVVSGPAYQSASEFAIALTPATHTLLRLFVAAGTMAGAYRIEGNRKP